MPTSKHTIIHLASVSNTDLAALVTRHRDNAGAAPRLHSKPSEATHYAAVQNGWADIFQELLDRRRRSAEAAR